MDGDVGPSLAARMSPPAKLAALLRSVRRRQWCIAGVVAVPWVTATFAVAQRFIGTGGAALCAAVLAAATFAFAFAGARRFNAPWLTRALDAGVPEMEDSTALLATATPGLSGLQTLQRQRVGERLARIELPDLRPDWPRRTLAISWVVAVLLFALAWVLPAPRGDYDRKADVGSPDIPRSAVIARITAARLTIKPPAYTGLPPRVLAGLDARAPAGSMLEWSLQVSPQPLRVLLVTRTDQRLSLQPVHGAWQGRTVLSASMLYRVVAAELPALDPRLHRVDAIPDRAPRVRVIVPSRTLNMATPGQRSLDLVFEADDDYAVASARLVVTLAQGGGENIGVRTLTFPMAGTGPRGHRRYIRSLELAVLGMQAGDDLIAQLHVEDNRVPQAQSARSASVILRWPPPAGAASSDMEGLVQRVLPAYFRSQRQIIIDSEALLKERGALGTETFLKRSDSIGVDQRVLRLRYGQFLGEEAEDGSHLPGSAGGDGDPSQAASSTSSLFADAHAHEQPRADAARGEDAAVESAHSDRSEPPVRAIGNASDVTAEFGHTHDIAEAATLLDPATQKLLRAALGEMWQAELHLRQGFPDRALPFEHRALDLIKQVQQADRIYLAKVGLEIPPIDEARRLTGKRDGLRDRNDALAPAAVGNESLRALWMELGRPTGSATRIALEASLAGAERELLSGAQSASVLDVLAAIDAVRMDAECEPCRKKLVASLWPLLPHPAANVRRRHDGDPSARAYLDALAREPRL